MVSRGPFECWRRISAARPFRLCPEVDGGARREKRAEAKKFCRRSVCAGPAICAQSGRENRKQPNLGLSACNCYTGQNSEAIRFQGGLSNKRLSARQAY